MRIVTFICVLLIASSTCAFASTTTPAPADEYFGRLQMSILGIRNQLVHLTRQVEANPADADAATGAMTLTEESIKEWEQKYPADPWLPKTVFMVVHIYAHVPTPAGHACALKALGWLISRYPQSEFAGQAVQEVNAWGTGTGQP